ncbi:MAG TPA: hypothetical protein VG817_00910 [Gemmatimonadales bacterium]|nr:hypothetical protein [Gemmatimonadales bacterium]
MPGLIALVSLVVVASVSAQGHASQDMAMSNPHLRMTELRPLAPGDQARADSIVAIARAAAGKYRDVALAEADGYRRFAPDIANQRVYHYTRLGAAVAARYRFDPAQPSSLLYRDDGQGDMRLVGVMYTAPPSATKAELDTRVPLSIGRWHMHTNICLPPAGTARDSLNTAGARFGFRGSLSTREACEAAGGRYHKELFGWMMHLNLFEPGPNGPWQDDHGGMRPH